MSVASKQGMKTIGGMSFPSSAFAYVPDPNKPSSWKLRLFDKPGDVPSKPSIRLTAAAAMALSPSGFRGNRAQIPSADLGGVKGRVASAWMKARGGSRNGMPKSLMMKSTSDEVTEVEIDYDAEKGTVTMLASAFDRMIETIRLQGGMYQEDHQKPPKSKKPTKPDHESNEQCVDEKKFETFQTFTPAPVIKIDILKTDDEERTVLGVVLEPLDPEKGEHDSQNDVYDEDEIRKTAWKWLEQFQQFGLMHKQIRPDILPLESYLAPVSFSIGDQIVKKGTWLLRSRVLDDQIWKDVKSKRLTGYSIGGSARRTPEKVDS